MKTRIIILFIGVLLSSSIIAQNEKLVTFCPDPEKDETICGFMNSNGDIVIPAGKYARIYSSEFDKIAFVSLKGKPGIFAINRSEQVLFEVFVFDNGPDYLSNGLFRIVENDKVGFANMAGEIVIPPIFQHVFPFQDNGLAIFNEGGELVEDGEYHKYIGAKWGAIDRQGKIIIPAIYEDGRVKSLKKEGNWYIINAQQKLELRK